jgi:selenophosphate synthetase-related protein
MAGLIGSVAMLLEANRLGGGVDLDLLPVPPGAHAGLALLLPCLCSC